jgi:hypothetical protein
MNRRARHLISTGHRPKNGADVICIFNNGEAIECYYNKKFDDFILYDKEWDMQPFHSNWFKAWCFDNGSLLNIHNAYDDFVEFSKEYVFPELLKSKKEAVKRV